MGQLGWKQCGGLLRKRRAAQLREDPLDDEVLLDPLRRGAETVFLIAAMPTQEAARALGNFTRVFGAAAVRLLLTQGFPPGTCARLRPIGDLTALAARMTKRVSPIRSERLVLLLLP